METEMLVFPDIKTRGNGQNGKKGCQQKKGMLRKLADIDVSARHVANMLPTFPTKTITKRLQQWQQLRQWEEGAGADAMT
jgi:hypothetical protein